MKKLCILAVATLMSACCNHPSNQGNRTVENNTPRDVFAKGELMTGNPNFTGEAWLEMFVTKADSMDCTVGNVTFAPGVRNSWHSHPGGQILLCTSGEGRYQEKGKPVQTLHPGDVVKIAPNVVHWHGAAPDKEFTHMAIGTQVSKGPVQWYEPVTDEEYDSKSGIASSHESVATAAAEPSAVAQDPTITPDHIGGKVLVAYFSVPETDGVDASSGASRLISDNKLMGNTQYVASVISEATGGHLFEVKTVHTYPASHKALIDAAKKEIDSQARPKLATHIENLRDYDIIFVGFPNWWYDMPMPIYAFFDEYDFSGKTIIPFCTHGGSRFSGAIKSIRELEKNATVLDGYAVARDWVGDSQEGILKWLKKIGMKR